MFVPTGLKKFTLTTLSCIFLASMPFTPTLAAPSQVMVAEADISLSDAVQIVREKTGGHVLSAKKVNSAEPVYVIKVLLPTGQVKSFRVSVATGQIQ